MFKRNNKKYRFFRLTIGKKLVFAISAIISILALSGIISVVEFKRMSTRVSGMIADNIATINQSTNFSRTIDRYNLHILSIVGKADTIVVSNFDPQPYLTVTDSIIASLCGQKLLLSDSLKLAYDGYVATSRQLDSVIVNDFTNTRDWYFLELQPKYDELRKNTQMFNARIHDSLQENSVSFDDSFYRSLVPGTVSVAAGIVLCLLLLVYLLIYFIKPLKKMLVCVENYKRFAQPYKNVFEGNDELQELNGDINDIIDENIHLKKRLRDRER